MSVFINLSNHPSQKWCADQTEKALEYGEIVDMTFPDIDPYCTDNEINALVEEYFAEITKHCSPVVMIQGEFVFTYRLIQRLKKAGIKTLAGCSERRTIEYIDENGATKRKSEFKFVAFREY